MMDVLLMGVTWQDVQSWLPGFMAGFRISVTVTLAALAFGIPAGLLLALGVQSKAPLLRALSLVLVEIGRGAPALVLLQFVYFGLPSAGISLTAFSAAVLALSWNTGAYTSEIIRAGLDAIPAGQREAAVALGLSRTDQLRFVLLPQGLRIAIPALMGFAILVFQGTSLCFAIALPEIISRAYEIGSMYFFYFPALAVAGLFFAAVCIPASFLVEWFEHRAGAHASR